MLIRGSEDGQTLYHWKADDISFSSIKFLSLEGHLGRFYLF